MTRPINDSENMETGRAGSPLHADSLNQKFDSPSSLNTRNRLFHATVINY
jgi:hypothetical protein